MAICPQCHSENLRRSRSRGVKEKLFKKLGWRAYRCQEKNCYWRGLIKVESFREIVKEFVLAQKINILIVISAIVLLALMIGIFLHMIS